MCVVPLQTFQFTDISVANLGAKSGLIFAGTSLLASIWVWWEVPESKGRDFAALDFLYQSGTPTRRFRGAAVPSLDDADKPTFGS